MKNCPHCGAQLPTENARFCVNCGTPLAAGTPPETPRAPLAQAGPSPQPPGGRGDFGAMQGAPAPQSAEGSFADLLSKLPTQGGAVGAAQTPTQQKGSLRQEPPPFQGGQAAPGQDTRQPPPQGGPFGRAQEQPAQQRLLFDQDADEEQFAPPEPAPPRQLFDQENAGIWERPEPAATLASTADAPQIGDTAVFEPVRPQAVQATQVFPTVDARRAQDQKLPPASQQDLQNLFATNGTGGGSLSPGAPAADARSADLQRAETGHHFGAGEAVMAASAGAEGVAAAERWYENRQEPRQAAEQYVQQNAAPPRSPAPGQSRGEREGRQAAPQQRYNPQGQPDGQSSPPQRMQPAGRDVRQGVQGQGGQNQGARDPYAQAQAPRPGQRTAMVQNIAQAAGAGEDDTRQAPRPMADPQSRAPRMAAPPPRPGSAGGRTAAPQRGRYSGPTDEWGMPKAGAGRVVRNVLLIILVFLIATFVATMGLLYMRNRPANTIDAFVEAVAAKDYAALKETVFLGEETTAGTREQIPPNTTTDWAAFCAAFDTQQKQNALKDQLSTVKPGADATGQTYEAVTLQKEPLFLFVNQYYVQVVSVELLAPDAAEGTTLTLDGGDTYQGTATDEGVVYKPFMPGRYSCQLAPAGATPSEPVEIEAFATAQPNRIEAGGEGGEGASAATATVTVENCLSDDAVISVNGKAVGETPQDGVVQLQAVPVGAEIQIVATGEDGKKMQSSVLFSDPAQTALRFENYTEVQDEEKDEDEEAQEIADKLTTAEIDQILASFYNSYLQCINAQSMDPIQLSTQKNTANLQARVTDPVNAGNTFGFVSAAAKEQSIVRGVQDGVPSVKLNGTFAYTYAPKDDEKTTQNGSNHQSVHLLYVDGKWLVDGFVFVDDTDFAANVVANF